MVRRLETFELVSIHCTWGDNDNIVAFLNSTVINHYIFIFHSKEAKYKSIVKMVEINDVEMKDGEKPAEGEPEVKKDQDVLTIEGTRHNRL